MHLHNLAMGDFARDYAIGVDAKPTAYIQPAATFQGIVRRDGPNAGKVATRNYIGILSTVNCSATVARGIADHFNAERLARFPNVDGVVALTHGSGCGMHDGVIEQIGTPLELYDRPDNLFVAQFIGSSASSCRNPNRASARRHRRRSETSRGTRR